MGVRLHIVLLLLALVTIVTACRNDDGISTISPGTVHPTANNIPPVTDLRFVLYEEGGERGVEQMFIDFIELESQTIGIREGDKLEMFGFVQDLVTDDNGTLYVLDSRYNEVRVYNHSHFLIGRFGSAGVGPEEFAYPRSLAITEGGARIIVLDRYGWVKVFSRQDSTFRFESSFSVVIDPWDMCAMNGHVYIRAYSAELGAIIHKYSHNGDLVASFGQPYDSPNPFVRQSLSGKGQLVCSEKHRIVGSIRRNVPLLTGYSEAGEIVWRVKFGDFKSAQVIEKQKEDGRPSILFKVPVSGESVFSTAFSDASGDFFVQYVTINDSTDEVPTKRHLFKVQAQTGEGTYLGRTNMRVYAIGAEHVFAGVNRPYPQVVIHEIKETLQ